MHDYVKPKYDEKEKLCYTGTSSFIVHVKKDYTYKDIEEYIQTRFDTSNDEFDRPRRKKKVAGLMKKQLGGKIMI